MQKTVGGGFLHFLECVKTVTFTKDLRKNPLLCYAG